MTSDDHNFVIDSSMVHLPRKYSNSDRKIRRLRLIEMFLKCLNFYGVDVHGMKFERKILVAHYFCVFFFAELPSSYDQDCVNAIQSTEWKWFIHKYLYLNFFVGH